MNLTQTNLQRHCELHPYPAAQNHRTPAELKTALDAIVLELKALDVASIPDCRLVDFAKTIQDVASYMKPLGARIEMRVLTDKVAILGAAIKPGITHRKWNDEELAASLAFEAFGLRAFKLDSPAAIEKLGENGQALVAVASAKPPANDRVVY